MRRRHLLLVPAWACGAAWQAAAGRKPGQTLSVGPRSSLRTLAQALRQAGDGDTIQLEAGVYGGDVGVAEQHDLTIRGLGGGALLRADGRHAEGKAILVTRGTVTLENLVFSGCRVPSGNGAGVRFERGHLSLRNCRFHDNEMGLLSSNDPTMTLEVIDCQFGGAPRHLGPLHHLLYVGTIGALRVQGSVFQRGWRGHLLKSRARSSVVIGNWLVDGPGGEASYELEFPNGGDVLIAGNVVAQSAATQNLALVSVGAEVNPGTATRLRMVHNTLVNHASQSARFVDVRVELAQPSASNFMARNLFAGLGALPPEGRDPALGNYHTRLDGLASAERQDYRLAATSRLWAVAAELPADLPPLLRFAWPVGTRAMPTGPLVPGALQKHDAPP